MQLSGDPQKSLLRIEWLIVIMGVLGMGTTYLSQTSLNLALPQIQETLGAELSDIQWLIDIYILLSAVLIMLGATLGDHYGHVRVFMSGCFIFMLGSIGAGFAPSVGWLIATRVVQGIGSAILTPSGFGLINATVASERLGRAMGAWSTMIPVVTLSGPLVAGWLIDLASWRAIFFIDVPFMLAALFIAYRYIPENRIDDAEGEIDWLGVLVLMLALGSLLFGLIEGPNFGWDHPAVISTLVGGLLGMGLFVWVESTVPHPVLPLHFFLNPTFAGITLATLFMGPFFTVMLFLTLNLQQVQGMTAFLAGLVFLPASILAFVISPLSGRWTDRFGAVPVLLLGILATAGGYLLLMLPAVPDNIWLAFLPGVLLWGFGTRVAIVPLNTISVSVLQKRYSGIAAGVNTAVWRIGSMIGIAVYGVVMLNRFRRTLVAETATLNLDEATREALWTNSAAARGIRAAGRAEAKR